MSYEEIKLDYGKAEAMIQSFNAGKQQLEQTNSQMKKIADQLQSGALLGKGGQAFTEAITGSLVPSIDKLTEKFEELAGDVQAAINYMQQADRRAKSKF
ncbi:MAG TPA: WXG100 family type VII secretion target [Anaerolineae bacterium]|nr:WXG100 family type VII secretion target [Anaerolineae bacterium]MCB0223962.1 WXG100 family type VII secretion target [Anaerolineae bacterium]MCB9105659.1 WXG100 family type VII secretion target [Anaerolineales bacterium]HRV91764.1 WXG100 family type VII secretion target [Anaerolineae bacterium]